MMNTLELLTAIALSLAAVLVLGWMVERRRIRAFYARSPRHHWSTAWREPAGSAASLDAEWRDLGYTPIGTLLIEGDAGDFTSVYTHPSLPVYGLVTVRGENAVACAMTFWEGGGTLITTAAPVPEARALAVDTGTARLVQLRVGGRPLALDGQHCGTVRAWALGKRTALPATREALIPQLQADCQQVRKAAERSNLIPFRGYLRSLLGRPERVLTF